MSDIGSRKYVVTMPDGSRWAIPVYVIARDRADNYKSEFGDDIRRSLKEDTYPLFESDPFECADWAKNNMNWEDVEEHAEKLTSALEPDYQEGWVNGEWEVV